jgi:hypothetical protein
LIALCQQRSKEKLFIILKFAIDMTSIDFNKIGFIAKENEADGKISTLYIVPKMNDHYYKYPSVIVCKVDLITLTVSVPERVSMRSIMANLLPINPREDNIGLLEQTLCQLPLDQQLKIISLYS